MPDNKKNEFSTEMPGFTPGNPTYFDNEVIDQLVGVVLELGAELAVTRDRLARLEEMLADGASVSLEELDNGRPSDQLKARLDRERKEFIERVYGRLYSRYGGDKASGKAAL